LPNRRWAEFESAAEVARTAARPERPGAAVARLAVLAAWERSVGAPLRTAARAAAFSKGTLTVEVLEPAWAREIERLSGEILGRLESALPRGLVTRIQVRTRRDGAGPVAAARGDAGEAPRADGGAAEEPPGPSGTGAPAPVQLSMWADGADVDEAALPASFAAAIREEPLRRTLHEVAGRYLRSAGRRSGSP
jgi:hypothetical protein